MGLKNPTDDQLWSPNFTNGWPRGAPNGVTIHTMEGWFDPSVAWLRDPKAQASAHFCVRRDGHIVQLVRQNDRAWHARTSGMYYFGIEHEARLRQEELLREAQERHQVLAARSSEGFAGTPRRSLLWHLLRVSWRKREQWDCFEAVGRPQSSSAAERSRGLGKH